MKIGSLFDGSGGFPLAGSLCGIEPVWAAEVEPYPIAVTRSRFPKMKHLGSVTDINGAEVEPVDIITFGSPCQDLSVAGKRAGLKHEDNGDEETTRSGLFMEAVRIIKEMREATNGEHPTFALWENVPGAFSSNKGEDFRIVLEELIKIVEPSAVMPAVPQSGWPYADSYFGDGWSLSYRVFDAQYWGVPQRRRRIYLVADFRGERAQEVLFEREGVRGYFATGGTPWQGVADHAEGSVGADDREGADVSTLTPWDSQGNQVHDGTGNNVFPCLRGNGGGGYQAGYVLAEAVGLDCYNQSLTGDKAKALTNAATDSDHIPCVINPVGINGDISGTLDASYYKGCGMRQGTEREIVFQPVEQYLFENHSQDTRYKGPLDVCPMLPAQLGTGGNNTPFVVEETMNAKGRPAVAYCIGNGQADQAYPKELVGALNCMHDQQAIMYKEEVIAIDRAAFNQGQNAQYEPQFYTDGTTSTLVAKGPSAVAYKTVRYIVRRLTPTECARLQGFADRWGNIEEKTDFTDEEYAFWLDVRNTHAAINGKATKSYTREQMVKWYNGLHTDSAEYKMWGNGIALPTALYCMQGIAKALEK